MRLDTYEQLISDRRLELAVALLSVSFPIVEQMTLVTFIQPQREVTQSGVDYLLEQQAVFACISQNPRHPQFEVMTTGVTSWRDFQRSEAEFAQKVGPDPVIAIFRKVIPAHADILRNLRELI